MSRTSIAVTAAGIGAFAAIATTTLVAQQPINGELTPPTGPVGDTTPSLADIDAKLSAAIAANSIKSSTPTEHW